MSIPRLEAQHVSKTFGRARVLVDASLVVQPGEVHALVGQNGSGKSTLIKVLTGYHGADDGATLAVDGVPIHVPVQWRHATAAGMSVVHQDLGLLDDLSVTENIGIGGFRQNRFTRRIDWKAQDEIAATMLARLGLSVDPRVPVGSLSPAERATVGIARAMRHLEPGRGVVILDEATRALPKEDLERFHALVRQISAEGTSFVMISHNLEEVLSIADKVTILRDGRVVRAGMSVPGRTEAELAKLMIGTEVERHGQVVSSHRPETTAARVEGLEIDGHRPFDLTVAQGEVVGITGLPGTGFEEIPYLVSGARKAAGGTVETARGTVRLRRSSVAELMRYGVALVPERRIRDGLATDLSIRDNVALPNLRSKGSRWFLPRGWQEQLAAEAIESHKIKAPSPASLIKELSGGNQQKVLLAKWLSVKPDLLVLHEPTQAVDVGARADLLDAIARAAASGMGVVITSTEPLDLFEACDRVLVLHPGEDPIELTPTHPDEILDAVYDTEGATSRRSSHV